MTAYRLDRDVAVISFDNPPVNGLSHAVRSGILDALARAQTDPGARAIVLTGTRDVFSAGADIREFGTPASSAEPTLRQVIERIETSPKPVVAAIAGTGARRGARAGDGGSLPRRECRCEAGACPR